jgi:hypothetical protein
MIASGDLPRFVRDMLSSPPRRGGGLNLWFYRVARVLHAFRSDDEIVALLQAVSAGEPVKHGEIERAVERSRATAWQPGQSSASILVPKWPAVNHEQREAITASGIGLVDLWERSPVRLEGGAGCTAEILDTVFPGNPLLCCGWSNDRFDTRPKDEWRKNLSALQLIVPSPMSKRRGLTQDGRESAHTLDNTGPRHFLVIEFDEGTADEHAAILLHLALGALGAPIALAVHSGNKSLHGWFYCRKQSEQVLRSFMQKAVILGADHATWTRCQFVRMPDGRRDNGRRQTVFFFNPGVVQ